MVTVDSDRLSKSSSVRRAARGDRPQRSAAAADRSVASLGRARRRRRLQWPGRLIDPSTSATGRMVDTGLVAWARPGTRRILT